MICKEILERKGVAHMPMFTVCLVPINFIYYLSRTHWLTKMLMLSFDRDAPDCYWAAEMLWEQNRGKTAFSGRSAGIFQKAVRNWVGIFSKPR